MNLADTDRRFLIAGALAAVLVLAAAIWFWTSRAGQPATLPEDPGLGTNEAEATSTVPMRTVELFFPGDDGRLHVLPRELPESPDPARNLERMVEALLAGPHGEFAAKALTESTVPEEAQSGEAQSGEAQSGEIASGEAQPEEATDEPDDTSDDDTPKHLGLPEVDPEDGLWPPLPAAVDLGRVYLLDDTVFLDLVVADGSVPMVGARGEILMLYSLVNTVLLNTEEAERLVLLWNGQQRSTFAGHFDTTRPLTPKIGLIAR